ncbi:MAG: hypothetical protein GX442_08640 [Candidatus Riflebacteria bacterium]|nr:hypothetical protein [Candidatus Riflebacteria bacterium]
MSGPIDRISRTSAVWPVQRVLPRKAPSTGDTGRAFAKVLAEAMARAGEAAAPPDTGESFPARPAGGPASASECRPPSAR